MSTSRSVDRLTYTYYTGQDGSEPNGPNCHNCMNELFHENKLLDVQMVFISTPTGLIPFTTRSLIYSYGTETPFSMTLSTEDFLVVSCTQCAQKAIRLELSEAMKAVKEGTSKKTKRKRTIKMECSLDADSETSSVSSMVKKFKSQQTECRPPPITDSAAPAIGNTTSNEGDEPCDCRYVKDKVSSYVDSQPDNSCVDDSYGKDYDLPFLYGRNPEEVNDPMSISDRAPIKRFWSLTQKAIKSSAPVDNAALLARIYFANQVTSAGLVFSYSKDLQKFVELSNEACKETSPFAAKIPFVSGTFIEIERLYNSLTHLKRSELIDDGFSQYMLRIYPNIKDINICSLCESPVSCEQNANGYFNHFLSSRHIAKAVENKWAVVSEFDAFQNRLSNYLKDGDRAEEAIELIEQMKSAVIDKTYSKNNVKYKHLFRMNTENNKKKNGK